MKGTITRYRKKDGRVSWGYYYKAGGEQFTKGGFATKDAASEALNAAIRSKSADRGSDSRRTRRTGGHANLDRLPGLLAR